MKQMQLVMYDEDFRRVLVVIQQLARDANAKGVFVVDRNGQLIGEAGELRGIDTTSLASLTAGCIAASWVSIPNQRVGVWAAIHWASWSTR